MYIYQLYNRIPLRPVLAIALLMLVLYHMCRVWIVMSCFEHFYPQASPVRQGDQWLVVKVPVSLPYTSFWEEPQGKQGLIRMNGQFYNITRQRYENDTLYTELKTNTTAREHFFSLVQQLQNQPSAEASSPGHPLSRMLDFLNQWAGSYLSTSALPALQPRTAILLEVGGTSGLSVALPSLFYPVSTPPPEA